MYLFVDLVLLAIIVLCAFKHYRSGLMCSVLNFGKLIIGVLCASAFGRPLGSFISQNAVHPQLSEMLYQKISSAVSKGDSLSEFFESVPDSLASAIKLFGGDISELRAKYSDAENCESVLRDIASTVSEPISDTVSGIVAYATVFVIAVALVSIAVLLLKQIKLPIITRFDKWLGLALGLCLGLLISSMLSTAIYSLLELVAATECNADIMNVYEMSFAFKFIYKLRIFEFIRKII